MDLTDFLNEIKDDKHLMILILKKLSLKGNLDIVRSIMNKINCSTEITSCVLENAAFHGHNHIISYIIENDYPVNKFNSHILCAAISNEKVTTVKLLLSYGFYVNDEVIRTVETFHHPEIASLLEKNEGINII